jgi:hypothetical protein
MAAPSPLVWSWCDRFGHRIGLLTANIKVVLTRPILDPAKELLGMQWLQVLRFLRHSINKINEMHYFSNLFLE